MSIENISYFDPNRPKGLRRRRVFIGPVVRSLLEHKVWKIAVEIERLHNSTNPSDRDPKPPAA